MIREEKRHRHKENISHQTHDPGRPFLPWHRPRHPKGERLYEDDEADGAPQAVVLRVGGGEAQGVRQQGGNAQAGERKL